MWGSESGREGAGAGSSPGRTSRLAHVLRLSGLVRAGRAVVGVSEPMRREASQIGERDVGGFAWHGTDDSWRTAS